MTSGRTTAPRCVIIAGPNGAGKTTFAREFLPKDTGVVHFVNVDLIAAGLSPFRPELAALAAGRLALREVDRLAERRNSWRLDHEGQAHHPAAGLLCRRRGPSPSTGGTCGAQNGEGPWHADLRLEEGEGRRRETVTAQA